MEERVYSDDKIEEVVNKKIMDIKELVNAISNEGDNLTFIKLWEKFMCNYDMLTFENIEEFNTYEKKGKKVFYELPTFIKYNELDDENKNRYYQDGYFWKVNDTKYSVYSEWGDGHRSMRIMIKKLFKLSNIPSKIFDIDEYLKNANVSPQKKLYLSEFKINTSEADRGEKDNEYNMALNTILYGPPGTGKTYKSVIYALGICMECSKDEIESAIKEIDKDQYNNLMNVYKEFCDNNRIAFTTFHQSYGYEEFIEGIKPDLSQNNGELNYKESDGVFKEFCEIASGDKNNKYVFIIDEINRGNISKIFGELITLIEETKRQNAKEEMKVMLPYSKKYFSVPKNVYILGTMNTADRSIAMIDTALRRRFYFIEMQPDYTVLDNIELDKGNGEFIKISEILKGINERIKILFDREHTIGHAFFTYLVDKKKDDDNNSIKISISELNEIFKNKIIPLLQEYFYDDYEKIALVLGEDVNKIEKNGKNIIYREFYEKKRIFNCKENNELIKTNSVYEIDYDALNNIETYNQMIIEELTDESAEDNNA